MNVASIRQYPASRRQTAGSLQTAENRLICLYCVTEQEPALEEIGLPIDSLHFVHHAGLYAVVSNVAESEFGEQNLRRNLADLEWVKTKVRVHEGIMEAVMQHVTVIPFKFGTLFQADASLRAMLEKYAGEFRTILKKLADKEEWGVKVYCNMEILRAACVDLEPAISEIQDQICASSAGKAYFLEKKKAELMERLLNGKLNEQGREVFRQLEALSSAARVNRLLPREVTERHEDMILNSAFLLPKEKVGDFVDRIGRLKTHYQNTGLSLDCTGPWPPYNFCGLPRQSSEHDG